MLPITDQGKSGGQSAGRRDPRERATPRAPTAEASPTPAPTPTPEGDQPAKSLIDEYA